MDRAALAQRIQGFGNVNPPPLEDETASNVAKRAVRNLGDMVGEEVAMTVQDFKEKGAVGAVKDAVADAGDILIDGDAQKVLANGPRHESPIMKEAVSKLKAQFRSVLANTAGIQILQCMALHGYDTAVPMLRRLGLLGAESLPDLLGEAGAAPGFVIAGARLVDLFEMMFKPQL
eukprot:Skav211969  [mRNA]  locus=scaffold4541:3648:14287:+ [translate_table: standard]